MTKLNQHLVLIDGYGFLFRAFHALPPLIRGDGINVGAVFGFTSMLTRIILEFSCSHLAVVFDSGGKTFRHDIFPEYKSHRPPAPEELIPQFPLVREAVAALNIDILQKKGFEADDLIATYAKQASNSGIKVTIISSDKDLMQLIDDNISLYDPLKSKAIKAEQVKEKFGVRPDQVVDVLSLIGDSSDFVPGVPGIGPKTAAELINKYDTLESIYQNIDELPTSKRKESLINNKDLAFLSQKLVILDDQVQLEQQLDDLRIKIAHVDQFKEFLELNNFRSLYAKAEKICQSFLEKNGEHHDPLRTVKVIELSSKSEIERWLDNKVNSSGVLSIIIEAGFICLASDEKEVAIITYGAQNLFEKAFSLKEFASCIISYLNDVSVSKIIHDVKKLYHILAEFEKIEKDAWQADDIQLISYVLNNGLHGHDLKSLIQTYFSLDSNLEIKEWLGFSAILLIKLQKQFTTRLAKEKLMVLYQRIEKPISYILFNMENNGIKIDRLKLAEIASDFDKRSNELAQEIHKLSGEDFNLASPKQLAEVLFNKMGLKPKNAKQSTNIEVLEELAEDGHIIAEKIIAWRALTKLSSTYTNSLTNYLDENDRVHTSFQMTVTSTGRLSSISPNLQNIPTRTEDGLKIRSAFVAKEGYSFISADYSQIELRLLAHIARIESLKNSFSKDLDIHKITASEVFEIPLEQVTAEIRYKAKAINFGIIYGISAFGLANQIKVPRSEAKQYIESYFKRYPEILQYMEDVKKKARELGYVETILGRRCYTKAINDPNIQIRNFAERAAINAPLQGSASDIIKKAMILLNDELERRNLDAKILLQVHDELIIEAKDDVIKEVSLLSQNFMQTIVELSVPLVVNVSSAKNWAELK